ncbi:hypothetical protein RhiXN_07944 [Rhizoctonia solani]|uniref:Uncharacterized protein n=1 Tax=Rhizoctonia solani TaxID=456999 RepID=A0A8H8P1N9_9AGAM|nr:uncharacterized protein RhiXN_07944 [Rhizoctonia solani]QRW22908.1 hypothetical protein RhiXN_07944 [Rhizoctonia solani]
MLLEPVFGNVALVTPKKELQCQIESTLDQDESLGEILQFLQNESKAPPSIRQAFKDYKMEAGLLFYQGHIVVPNVGSLRRIYCISSTTAPWQESKQTPTGMWIPPLELPNQPWQHISYNMIVNLPKDGNYNSILVIIDSFTNM